jgi:hypothetical protein
MTNGNVDDCGPNHSYSGIIDAFINELRFIMQDGYKFCRENCSLTIIDIIQLRGEHDVIRKIISNYQAVVGTFE